jgi:hypothetical protein
VAFGITCSTGTASVRPDDQYAVRISLSDLTHGQDERVEDVAVVDRVLAGAPRDLHAT